MNTQRDRFLIEFMGKCWHRFTPSERDYCLRCNKKTNWTQEHDFSTWEDFGKLLKWTQDQNWYVEFKAYYCGLGNDWPDWFIMPNQFANIVFEFLNKKYKEYEIKAGIKRQQ